MSVENTTRSNSRSARTTRALGRTFWRMVRAIGRAAGRKARRHPYVAIWAVAFVVLAFRLGV